MRAEPATDYILAAWQNGDYTTSDFRPVSRVTVSRLSLAEYALQHRTYRSWLAGDGDGPREVPNIATVKIDRSLDSDAATCEITMQSVKALEVGDEPEYKRDIDNEGWYTPTHGVGEFSVRWGYLENEWRGWLQPDRIIQTYQGFGADFDVDPNEDPHLLLTGVWVIDKVSMSASNKITISCRDLGELLLDQYVYQRVFGGDALALTYETMHNVTTDKQRQVTTTIPGAPGGVKLGGVTHEYNSDYYWTSSGSVAGHTGPHAFDADPGTYWLSIGNSGPNVSWAYEWIQAKVGNQSVGGVRFLPWDGNYVVYVGVKVGGVWQGTDTVPYDPAGVGAPNFSDEKYVLKTTCGWEQWCSISLPKIYQNAQSVRLTFHNLADSNYGRYQYRAGVRQFEVYNGPVSTGPSTVTTTVTDHIVSVVGQVSDYTDIVKDIVSIAGFFEPGATPPDDALTTFSGEAAGRAYGDFEMSGTAPLLEIPQTEIDKRALMDVVRYVEEVLGFVFFIDERGGVVFRSPNLWQVGNYLTGHPDEKVRTTGMITIDESETLVDWSVDLSNETKRKWIVVGNGDTTSGSSDQLIFSSEVAGKEPITIDEFPLGVARLSMWTDQSFASVEECTVMADMVKLRQWFRYRVGKATIVANPMLQIDDQIRVYERRTGEGYIHYIQGISSSWDADSGKWTMDLTTSWLGEQPTTLGGTTWLFDIDDLSSATQDYLFRTGKLTL